MSETTMTPVERLRAAEAKVRELHATTVEKPEPSGLDLDALRSADFGAIFIDPDVALAMAEVFATQIVRAETVASWRQRGMFYGQEVEEQAHLALADAILGSAG